MIKIIAKIEGLGLCNNQFAVLCENGVVVSEKKAKLRNPNGASLPLPVGTFIR